MEQLLQTATDGARHVPQRKVTPKLSVLTETACVSRLADWRSCLFPKMAFICYFKREKSTNHTAQTLTHSSVQVREQHSREREERALSAVMGYTDTTNTHWCFISCKTWMSICAEPRPKRGAFGAIIKLKYSLGAKFTLYRIWSDLIMFSSLK